VTFWAGTTVCWGGAQFLWTGTGAGPAIQFGQSAGAAAVHVRTIGRSSVDMQDVTNGVAVTYHSAQRCAFDVIEARNAYGQGHAILSDATSGALADFGNYNNAGNDYSNLYAYNCFVPFYLHGASSSAVITNNRFGLLYAAHCFAYGLYADQWCDSNAFGRVEIAEVANNQSPFVLNSSASVDQGVYANTFELLTIDCYGLTGTKVITLGPNGVPNTMKLETSPGPLGTAGTLLTVNGTAHYEIYELSESPWAVVKN
jgi:hypothetical protein